MSFRRLFVVAGDASGDVHGAAVIRAFQRQMPEMAIEAIGGQQIEATGIKLFYHQQHMGALGTGFISAIPSHWALGRRLEAYLKAWQPDAVLLIDYGGFNLWMAEKIKKLGIKVFYYIPPQVWASRRGRLKRIKAWVDHVFCIFPFEPALYAAAGIAHTYVGHPLVSQLPPAPDRQTFCQSHNLDPTRPIIGVFPGSRRREIGPLLGPMLAGLAVVNAQFPGRYQYVLALSGGVPADFFSSRLAQVQSWVDALDLKILSDANHAILALSQAVVAASGTVTLEAALYGTPAVIVYRLSSWALFMLRRFAYVRHIGLPNLLGSLPEGFLPELVGPDIPPQAISDALLPFLDNTSPQFKQAEAQFTHIREQLGQAEAATCVMKTMAQLMGAPLQGSLANSENATGNTMSLVASQDLV